MQKLSNLPFVNALFHETSDPLRHSLPPKPLTNRYSKWMSTNAAEDPRLGHGAVRLLQMIRCFAGRHSHCETTRKSLGDAINRHKKSIGRYLDELKKFGYIRVTKRVNRQGMITGLYIYLTTKVLPAFKDKRPVKPRNQAGTKRSPINVESISNGEDLSTLQPVNKSPKLTETLLHSLLTITEKARNEGQRLDSTTLASLHQLAQDSLIHRSKDKNEST